MAYLELKGFNRFARKIGSARFRRRLRKHVRLATAKNALFAEGAIKRDIAAGRFEPNSPMTVKLKGSSRPLVDSGVLMLGITHLLVSWSTALVGVVRSRQVSRQGGGGSYDLLDLAFILHEGGVIRVTPRMRRYLAMMGVPIKASTTRMVIPPRPFLDSVLNEFALYLRNWDRAVQRALEGED